MATLTDDMLNDLERLIYLPMVMTVLAKDRSLVQQAGFKLPRPYLELLEAADQRVQMDLKKVHEVVRRKGLKVVRGEADELFTEYIFYHQGYEEHRRYLNVRLRNQVEELLHHYLLSGSAANLDNTSKRSS